MCVCDKCFVDVVVLVCICSRISKKGKVKFCGVCFWLGKDSKLCRRLFSKLIQLYTISSY